MEHVSWRSSYCSYLLTQHRERSGNNQANPKPQVGDTPSANDSVYYYPYISYKIILDKKLVNGKEVVVYDSIYKNGKGVEPKEFVTRIPYEELENPANPSWSYLENLEAPADADVYEKARIEVLKNLKKSFAEMVVSKPGPHMPNCMTKTSKVQPATKI